MASDLRAARTYRWEGPAELFDGKEAKSHPVQVILDPEGLTVKGHPEGGVHRPKEMALVDRHGNGDFRLELKAMPGSLLLVRSGEALRLIDDWRWFRKGLTHGIGGPGKILTLFALTAALGAFLYLYGLDWASSAVMQALPERMDRKLGAAVIGSFTEQAASDSDAVLASALRKSAAEVAALGGPGLDSVRIFVVRDTSIVNAFAFPGGFIVAYSGLLMRMDDQQEWLGLLAHEAAHVSLRHGTRRIVRSAMLAGMASLFFGDVSGLSSVLLENAQLLLSLDYSRKDEAEADAFAREKLPAAGHSVEGLVGLFEKLDSLQQVPGWAGFLSSHPATGDRLAASKAAVEKDRKPKDFLTAEEWRALSGRRE